MSLKPWRLLDRPLGLTAVKQISEHEQGRALCAQSRLAEPEVADQLNHELTVMSATISSASGVPAPALPSGSLNLGNPCPT